jgi:hypothetical protein
MRIGAWGLSLLLIAGLSACSKKDSDSAAREAGRTAYKIKEKTQEAAKKAGKELKEAGKEMRQGWNEAKREKKP